MDTLHNSTNIIIWGLFGKFCCIYYKILEHCSNLIILITQARNGIRNFASFKI